MARGISRRQIGKYHISAGEIAAQGIKEIVLTGVNIGDYGKGNLAINATSTLFGIDSGSGYSSGSESIQFHQLSLIF